MVVGAARRWAGVAALAVALVVAACGGGASSVNNAGGGTDLPGNGPSGGGGTGGGTGGGQVLDVETRSAATLRVADKYEELVAAHTPNPWQALRDWVLTQPEFVDAGAETDGVWARFTDGRYYVYVDDWKVPAGMTPTPPTATPSARGTVHALASPHELPAAGRAVILMMPRGEFADFGGQQLLDDGRRALQAQGWDVTSQASLSLDTLLAIGTPGLLYINSHSSIFGPPNLRQYAIFTATESVDGAERRYADDLADGSLIYTRERSETLNRQYGKKPNYAITSKFVRKHWAFAPNSLVVLMACHGGEPDAVGFRDALQAQGAGTIVAWNGSSNPNGYVTVRRLLSRLTGDAAGAPATPPNRAFDFAGVWLSLDREGLLLTPSAEGGDPATVRSFGTKFDLSNPIITELQVTGHDTLVVHGDFGTVPGSVSVGGVVLPATWAANGLSATVVLPTGSDDPPGSFGDVVVTARGLRSNARTLTSWRGRVTYVVEDLPEDGWTGTLQQEVVVDLHLRGDPYAMRYVVNGEVVDNTWNIAVASDTRMQWQASGTRSDPFDGPFETWSGSGMLELQWPFIGTGGSVLGRIDAVERRLELTPMVTQLPRLTITRRNNGTEQRALWWPIDQFGFSRDGAMTFDDHRPLSFGTYLPMDAAMNVPAGRHVAPLSDTQRFVIQWSSMTAQPAFDDRIGR